MRSRYLLALLLASVLLLACSIDSQSASDPLVLSNIPTQHAGSELTFEGEPDPQREIIRTFVDVPPFYMDEFTSIEYLNYQGLIPPKSHSVSGNSFYPNSNIKKEEAAEMVLRAFDIEPDILAYSDCISGLNNEPFAPYFCHALGQKWLEPYEEEPEDWQKDITEIEFWKLLLDAAFKEELRQLTENEIEKAVYDEKDIKPEDWQAPYIALIIKKNLDVGGNSFSFGWADAAETLARAQLLKQEYWDF